MLPLWVVAVSEGYYIWISATYPYKGNPAFPPLTFRHFREIIYHYYIYKGRAH